MLWACVWHVIGSNSYPHTGYPEWGFSWFPHSLQPIAVRVPPLGHELFLSNPFQSISHSSTRRCMFSIMKLSLNNLRNKRKTMCDSVSVEFYLPVLNHFAVSHTCRSVLSTFMLYFILFLAAAWAVKYLLFVLLSFYQTITAISINFYHMLGKFINLTRYVYFPCKFPRDQAI